ncbi:10139_t:CDS:2, partial [Funneliformis mosseae]
ACKDLLLHIFPHSNIGRSLLNNWEEAIDLIMKPRSGAAHSSHGDAAKIASLIVITKSPNRMDSQCKYCSVARGDADVYRLEMFTKRIYGKPSFFLYDHSSGAFLVQEAGDIASDIYSKPLDFI